MVQAAASSFGRPEEEALSRELFRRPVKAHSHEKACVGSLL